MSEFQSCYVVVIRSSGALCAVFATRELAEKYRVVFADQVMGFTPEYYAIYEMPILDK